MKKILLLLVTLTLSIQLWAQLEVKEDSFHIVDGFININPDIQTDDNDKPYSVIKIKTENINNRQRRELVFEGNAATYFELEYKVGEIWVYISYYATYIKISHPDLSSTEFWFPFDMEPKKGYDLTLVYNPPVDEEIVNRLQRIEDILKDNSPSNQDDKQIVDKDNKDKKLKKAKIKFNVNVGLSTQKQTLESNSKAYGYLCGISLDLNFKNGLGLELSELSYNYYTYTDNSDWYYSSSQMKCRVSSIYFSPIKIKYTLYLFKNSIGLHTSTGPSFDQWISFKYSIGDESYNTNIFNSKSQYYYWDIKVGLSYRFIKFSVCKSVELNKKLEIITNSLNYHNNTCNPWYFSISIML